MFEQVAWAGGSASAWLLAVGCLVLGSGFVIQSWRLRNAKRGLREYALAIDNMAQGICTFNKHRKMVFCNRRYLEMYGLHKDQVAPGATVDRIVELRYKAGTNPKLSREEYLKWRGSMSLDEKQRGTVVELADGRVTEIRQEATPDGGYVATHEDITQRQQAEREQTIAIEQAKRRAALDETIAGFRLAVEAMVYQLGEDAGSLNTTALALSSVSAQMSDASAAALTVSDKSSRSAQSASTSAEELSFSISAISRQLNDAAMLVSGSVTEANTADSQIAELGRSVEKIDDVVRLIQQIAAQTNLLALNATIEAARAGAVGKGFAVVAAEVKALAVQTALATDQVASQISLVRNSAKLAINAIHNNATRLTEIGQCTSAVASALEEQDHATSDILSNVMSASAGAQEIGAALGEVDQSANETRHAATQVLAASKRVEDIAGRLSLQVVDFLKKTAA